MMAAIFSFASFTVMLNICHCLSRVRAFFHISIMLAELRNIHHAVAPRWYRPLRESRRPCRYQPVQFRRDRWITAGGYSCIRTPVTPRHLIRQFAPERRRAFRICRCREEYAKSALHMRALALDALRYMADISES